MQLYRPVANDRLTMQRRASLFRVTMVGAIALAACETVHVEAYPCPEGMDCSGEPPVYTGTGTSVVGGPCQASGDCVSGTCVTAGLLSAMGVDTTHIDIPGGMCSQSSCVADTDCGDGGTCANGTAFGNPSITICLRTCENITGCRWKEGYSCFVEKPAETTKGVCLPDSVIAAIYCPTGCP